MTTNKRESEWQFDAKDINTVANWLQAYPADQALAVTLEASKAQVDRYLDTADWRMLHAGYGLRVRRKAAGAEVTMKSIAAAVDGLRQRSEITESLVATGVDDCELVRSAPGDVGVRVRRITGKIPLQVLFETHTHRTVYAIVRDGRRLGEVDLDETTFPGGDPDRAICLQRIEVETSGGADDLKNLAAFVKHMATDCNLRDAEHSKFEAGLLSRDLKPHRVTGADFGATDIDGTSTIGELAWAVLRKHFADMLAHEPGARLGEDAEQIHQMRVATRRLRAALNLFQDVLPKRVSHIREELGWVAGELGATRDLDVMLEQIEAWGIESADKPEDANAHHTVALLLAPLRVEEHLRLLAIFDSERYQKVVANFTNLLRKPPSGPSWAEAPVLKAVPELIKERYRKVRKQGDALRPDSPPPDYHQFRIRTKRLRYGLEFTKRLYGKPVKDTLAGMAALQDVLGVFQDAQTAISQLNTFTAEGKPPLPPRTIQAIEIVVRHYEKHAMTILEGFPKAYQHLKGRKWKRLFMAMK